MRLSVIVVAFDIARELPRTIHSLSPLMQRDIDPSDYEIIVVGNESMQGVDLSAYAGLMNLRRIRVSPVDASPSPATALNAALMQAEGDLVGAMINGAHLASPGLLISALRADRLDPRAVILSLDFHLGSKPQTISVFHGYNQSNEDRLLEIVRWCDDGYRLFDISVFAGSSNAGWFEPVSASNAIFMRRTLWDEVVGFEERFKLPGGESVSFELLSRAVDLPKMQVVTLLGEGTFRQIHGDVRVDSLRQNDVNPVEGLEHAQERAHQKKDYKSIYVGQLRSASYYSIGRALLTSNIAGYVGRAFCPPDPRNEQPSVAKGNAASETSSRSRALIPPSGALFVVGMHRSGTSALAGVLCQLGYSLPGEPLSLAPDNPRGHFESEWVKGTNDRFLRRLGSSWSDPCPLKHNDPAALHLDDLQAELDISLKRAFASARFLVIKDPRICLLTSTWKAAVERAGHQAAFVLPIRHPAEVAQSLLARDRIALPQSFAVWLKYVLSAEHATRNDRRCIVSFSRLLDDWETTVDTAAATLGFSSWPADKTSGRAGIDGFLEGELLHHRNSVLRLENAIEAICSEVWHALQKLTIDAADLEAIRTLDTCRCQYENAGAMFAPLIDVGASGVAKPALALHLNGTRLKVPNRPEVWLIFHGKRHHIVSSKAYDALFGNITNIKPMPTVDHITRGIDLADDVCLIRGAGSSDIFLLNENEHQIACKQRIGSWACFTSFDFDLSKVRDLPHAVVNAIPEGRPLC